MRKIRANTLANLIPKKQQSPKLIDILTNQKTMKYHSFTLLSAAMAFGLVVPAMAATPTTFSVGDLVLTFQKVGDTDTVYADLGSATSFRGASAGTCAADQINFLDLNATLTSAFGAGWASDPAVFSSVSAVYSSSGTSNTVVNGDAARTLYVSATRNDIGTAGQANSGTPTVGSNTDMTGAAAQILAQNAILGSSYSGFGQTVSDTSISLIDDKQPITVFGGSNIQGTAFGVFAGGIAQAGSASSFGTLGAVSNVEFALDLYRIVAVNNKTNQINGTLRSGDFQGTLTVSSSGQVSFLGGAYTPAVTTQPTAVTVNTGNTATLSVVATGNQLTYQWYNGASGDTSSPIVGATSASYTTSALTATTNFWVRASNVAGSVDSGTATVSVITGDLILTFQKVGSNNTVYADLGSASSFRGAANKLNIADLSAVLTQAFGADWASNANVFSSVSGVYSSSGTSNTVINGDASRTLYVSATRNDIGTPGQANSGTPTVGSNTDMTGAAAQILAQNAILASNYDVLKTVSDTSVSQIDDKQPITVFGGSNIQGTAFGVFAGGIAQAGSASSFGTLGVAGNVEFALDLYRIVAVNNKTNQVNGTLRSGDFQGTVTVDSNGIVSFVAASTASPFQSWIAGYSSITAADDQLASADPDHDGLNNLTEFLLGGNPSVASASIVPTITDAGDNLVFGFTRSAAAGADSSTAAVVQYSTDLSNWTNVETTSTTAGEKSVNIPKSNAVDGKLFSRLKVTQP